MNEAFLHYIWKFKLFNHEQLVTSLGESVQIINAGEHNTSSGPDFFNARIKIGNTLWAGNVEIHLKASDWIKHTHHHNKMYDNIILHVVYESDKPVFRKDGKVIPVLELKNKINMQLWERYNELQKSASWIPCAGQIKHIDTLTINNRLDRLLVERMENRAEAILHSLQLNNNSWEETFYHYLARNFGFKVNAVPFELLAKSLPLLCLAKHKNNIHQIESLLFGQAGLLEGEFNDEYPRELKKEYGFLKQKFQLVAIAHHLWKFLRLRPVNFPTIRIAQFARLIYNSSHLFSKIILCNNAEETKKLFEISTSPYWETHYVFDKQSAKKTKNFGEDAVHVIIINTVAPILFVYGMKKQNEQYKEKALMLLETVPAENNVVIRRWKETGITAKNSFHSQALLQLKNEYCAYKKCLSCSIGNKLLNSKQ